MPVANPCILSQVTNAEFERQIKPEERAMFWQHAKAIGANTGVSHGDVIAKMAAELDMPQRLVAQALDGPKSIRKLSEEVRLRQRNSQRFLAENSRFLANLDKTGLQRMLGMFNEGTRGTVLAYHGPVPPVTHAVDLLLTDPIKFAQLYGRGFASLSKNSHERVMTRLEQQPHFKTFVDAGAPISREVVEGFHKMGWAGRAMDAALKPVRYKFMERDWEKAPASERTPEYAKLLAQQYAHATGALVRNEPVELFSRPLRKLALAPQLTPSKIAKSIIDPIQTAKTFERMIESKIPGSKVRPPTPAERRIAWGRTKRAARYLATTAGALKLNQAVLSASGSQQRVNWDDPTRSDFLAFKFGGKMWRMRGTLEIAALISKIGALEYRKHKYGQATPEEAIARYSEYKLAPGIGFGKELISSRDLFGRPVPWSSDVGTARFPRKNVIEFAGEHGPIFLGHAVSAFHEALRDEGVDTRQAREVIRAFASHPQAIQHAVKESALAGVTEFFGINVQPDRYVGR